MTRTTTTVEEYDAQGNLTKRTVTTVETQDAAPSIYPVPYWQQPWTYGPYRVTSVSSRFYPATTGTVTIN